ncbi:Uncharacterised protein [Mycobacteroides abscessus]|nr:Uncharacterised protein [Mycobacteroides abscessus]
MRSPGTCATPTMRAYDAAATWISSSQKMRFHTGPASWNA